MIACLPNELEHQKQMDSLIQYYNKKGNLTAAYGNLNQSNEAFVRKNIATLYEETNQIVFSKDYIPEKNGKLNLSVYNQARNAIDRWDKFVGKDVNSFEAWVRTPSGIFSKDPNLIRFNKEISGILNTERQNKANYADNLSVIANDLKKLMSDVNDKTGNYSRVKNRIDDLYDKISERSASGLDYSDLVTDLNKVLGSEDTKRVLETYTMMMERMSIEDLNKFMKSMRSSTSDNFNGYSKDVMMRLVGTVTNSKELLSKMGDVNIKGLSKMKDVVKLLYAKNKQLNSTQVSRIHKTIDGAIDRIKAGLKDGRYFPHYAIESQLKLEHFIDKIDPFMVTKDSNYAEKALADIQAAVDNLPSVMKSASKEKNFLFQKDPIKVLESYSQNAIAFNKKQFLMDSYLKTIHDLKPTKTDFDGLDKVFEYLSHKYIATSKGNIDASNSVMKMAGTVSKLQTMSKMGLSVTGAVRNATQHFWYVVETGFMKYAKGQRLLKSNSTYTSDVTSDGKFIGSTMSQIIDSMERDSGYFFDDINVISKGGLVDMSGVDRRTIKMNVDDNGNPFITYKRNGISEKFDDVTANLTGKSLAFHRITENMVRRTVYRNSFANHFDMLYNNSKYFNGLVTESGRKEAIKKIKREAHNMALNWVRMTQFEYSTADRPLLFGGGTTNASVIGNAVFQFFPYAAHMFEYNNRIIRDGFNALKKGDFNSYKFGAAARLFGFQIFGVGLASIILNNEFEYMIENDTYNRLKKLYGLMTAENISDVDFGNGIAQQLSGPAVSDMLYWMEAAGFTNNSDSDIGKLLFGYYGIQEMSDSEKEQSKLNRVSVSLAKVYRSKDAVVNGNLMDILRTNLLLYPSQRTRDGHDYLMGMLGIKTKRSQREQQNKITEALSSLPDQEREKILSIIGDIKKKNENKTVMPTGINNITPR